MFIISKTGPCAGVQLRTPNGPFSAGLFFIYGYYQAARIRSRTKDELRRFSAPSRVFREGS